MDRDDIAGRIEEAPRLGAIRRQQWRQIFLPFLVGFVFIAAIAGALVTGGPGTGSLWADLALMYLAGAAGVIGLLFLAVVGLLAYGIGWLIPKIPGPAGRVRRAARRVAAGAKRGSEVAVAPVLKARSAWAGVRSIRRAVRSARRGR